MQGATDEVIGTAAALGAGGAVGLAPKAGALVNAGTKIGQYGRGIGLGAAGGAAYEFADGEGGIVNRSIDAIGGAGFGAAGGAAGVTLSQVISAALENMALRLESYSRVMALLC